MPEKIIQTRTIERKAYLRKSTHRRLGEFLRQQTELYNNALSLWRLGLCEEPRVRVPDGKRRKGSINIKYKDFSRRLTFIRENDAKYEWFGCEAQRSALKRAWRAIENFYRRCKNGEKKKGSPRIKRRTRSFDVNTGGWTLKYGGVNIKGIGCFKVKSFPQGITNETKCPIRIVQTANRVKVQFIVERQFAARKGCKPIGLDCGITERVVMSDGDRRYGGRIDTARLKRLQRQKSSSENEAKRDAKDAGIRVYQGKRILTGEFKQFLSGRRNYAKRVRAVAREYNRIKVRERNALHKITSEIVEKTNRIAVEDLEIKGMVRNKNLARPIHEQQWGARRTQLTYKAESAGGEVVPVKPQHTSQTCSKCGARDKSYRNAKRFKCGACGHTMDADLNASINILRLGFPDGRVMPSRCAQDAGQCLGNWVRPRSARKYSQKQLFHP